MAGKHIRSSRPPRRRLCGKRAVVLLAALVVLAVAAVSGTVAFLIVRHDAIQNTFVPGYVSCEVTEAFDGVTKTNVAVKNTGNVPVYIRVKLLPYWYDSTQDKPTAKTAWTPDFTSENGWTRGADGFYYYTQPVAPTASTSKLIPTITLEKDEVTLARQVLEIVASCVQALPDDVVVKTWGGSNGSVTGVSNGALQVTTGTGG